MRPALLGRLLLAAALLSACRCEEWSPISDVEAEFRLAPSAVDFGRVLEGNLVLRTVRVVSTSRATQRIQFFTEPPFSAPPPLELRAGASVEVEVRFDARDTPAEGELVAVAEDSVQVVRLSGEGVRPLECRPSAECRVSTFNLDTNACVETVANDGLPCQSDDLCVENAACRAGACVGEPRTCDDANVCTLDACSPTFGCVYRSIRCPRPTEACMEATCHPVQGCGVGPAPDLSLCGEVSCVEGRFCLSGACLTLPTPDGTLCAPPTPCQGEGTCQAQVCVRPDAGVLTATLSLPLPGGPAPSEGGDPALVAHGGNLFAELCDGGCALASWTQNGFERFILPHEDARPRRVLGVTGAGVWVAAADTFELYDVDTGALRGAFPFTDGGEASFSPAAFAIDPEGTLWAAVGWQPDAGEEEDAGPPAHALLRLPADGGEGARYPLEEVWRAPELALDEGGALYLLSPGDFVQRLSPSEDGGAPEVQWRVAAAPGQGLQVGRERVLVAAAQLLSPDGGRVGVLADAGAEEEPLYPVRGQVLLTATASFSVYRSCTTPFVPPCAEEEQGTWVRAFEPADAGVRWVAQVIDPVLPGFVEAMVNVDGGVALLTQRFPDGGAPELSLQGYFDGDEYLNCPLEGGGRLGAALFDAQALHLLRERDGGWTLDSFDFSGAPLDYSGWGSRGALGGTRRAR